MSGDSIRRYQTVYAKTLKLHKGVDNRLQFQLINQDQKPVNVTGKQLSFRILSEDGGEILFSKMLTNVVALNGIVQLDTDDSDIIGIESQFCHYTIEMYDGTTNLPVFVDHNSGARGKIQIVNSVMPDFTPSNLINVPNHQLPVTGGPAITYYSSIFSARAGFNVTAQVYFANYSGTVQIQGSSVADTDWYDIEGTTTYTNQIECDNFNIIGYHPYMRFKFVSTGGDATQIYTR
jgi:hypothetical protein